MSEANDHKFGPLVGLPIALNDDTHIAFSAGACYVTQAIADAIKVACDGS